MKRESAVSCVIFLMWQQLGQIRSLNIVQNPFYQSKERNLPVNWMRHIAGKIRNMLPILPVGMVTWNIHCRRLRCRWHRNIIICHQIRQRHSPKVLRYLLIILQLQRVQCICFWKSMDSRRKQNRWTSHAWISWTWRRLVELEMRLQRFWVGQLDLSERFRENK